MTALQILKKVRSEMRPNAKIGEYELPVILKAMHEFAALRQPPVSGRSELLSSYFKWHKEQGYVSHKDSDIDEFLASNCH